MKFCNHCKKNITDAVYNFSKKKYGKALCMDHQPKRRFDAKKSRLYPPRFESRKKSTPEAIKLGYALKKRGWKVELEKYDGYKHIDIAITKAKVNIEVDGAQHNFSKRQALADLKRTFHSFKKGFVTLRIPNSLVKSQDLLEETADFIHKFLGESLGQLEDEDYY